MGQKRSLTVECRDWLEAELHHWQQSGILQPAQTEAIRSLYETHEEAAATRRAWYMAALWSCAAVLFGAAMFLLVSFNWEALPAAAKLAIIFGVLALTYGLAFYLRLQTSWRRVSDVVFLLGGLFYGAAIWLIAQIFHMDAHYPDGFFWWAMGLLPLAMVLDVLLLQLLLAAVLSAWCASEILGYGHLPALLLGWRVGRLPNGAYLALPVIAAGLAWSYRHRSPWALMAWVPALAFWTILQPFAWHWHDTMPYFAGAVGALLLIVAESHARRSTMAIPFRLCGALLFGGALIPLSYYDFNDYFREESAWIPVATAVVISVWACLALAISESLRYWYAERGNRSREAMFEDIRSRQWPPLAMTALMAILSLVSIAGLGNETGPIVPTVLANLAILGMSLWLMRVGLVEDRATPFVGGVGFFMLWVIMRYVDLFGNVGGMLGAAGLFALCGLALVGIAFFWRERKKVIHVQ